VDDSSFGLTLMSPPDTTSAGYGSKLSNLKKRLERCMQ
jgi:hypothetical protein